MVGVGGYTSAGVAVAEWLRGGRIVLHEQNSVPGRTNRMLARLARKVCVTFEESTAYFPRGKTVVTGLPVRPDVIRGVDRRAARESLGLRPEGFVLLVLGGSQGARRINEMTLEAVPALTEAGLQVLHQSGAKNYEGVVSRKPEAAGYLVRPYIEDMAAAYSAADLVVSRAGASTIAEVAVRGLPAVLIPYPHHRDMHQMKNAEVVARAGAGLAVEEGGLAGSALAAIVLDLAGDPGRLEAMARASKELARPNAAEEIAKIVLEVARA